MSKYTGIDQLLREIGTSDRSAVDPWTLSRSDRGTVKQDAFRPAVVADLGAPWQDAISEIQSSEQITHADAIASSPSNESGTANASTGSGILGGLLNLFPMATGIAKLFGLGNTPPPPALTPYELPPTIAFEGAMSGPMSGLSSLSYGANGLPRTSAGTSSNFTGAPEQQLTSLATSSIMSLSTEGLSSPISSSVSAGSDSADVLGQLSALPGSTFLPESPAASGTPGTGLMPPLNVQHPAAATPFSAAGSSGITSFTGSGASSSSTQTGQSILVQVQAMDSQSFMDHSQDIARAVRQAMLNMNSLNDVILDL